MLAHDTMFIAAVMHGHTYMLFWRRGDHQQAYEQIAAWCRDPAMPLTIHDAALLINKVRTSAFPG